MKSRKSKAKASPSPSRPAATFWHTGPPFGRQVGGDELKAGKLRYISTKLNGVEGFAAKKSGQATDAMDTKLGLAEKAQRTKAAAASAWTSANTRFGITEKVNAAKGAVADKAGGAVAKGRGIMAARAAEQVNSRMDMVAEIVVRKLNNSLDLPEFLAKPLENMVVDLIEDIKYETAAGVETFIVKEQEGGPTVDVADVGCLGRARGFILYHWSPYDHAIGHQLADPVYLFLKLLCILPGMAGPVHLLIFALLDKRDDYSMVKFILDFKGLQALTLGIGAVLLGAARCAAYF